MESFILQITPFIKEYGVLGVFLLSLIEEVIAPIPSSVVLMAAGFFLLPTVGSMGTAFVEGLWRVILPASAGLTLGALLVYSLTYVGGEPLIRAWGKRLGLSWERVERWRERLTRGHHDELVVFGLRAFPLVPNFLLSAVCGLMRYPTKSFFFLTLLGSIVRAFLMSMIGWSVGEAYLTYAARISQLTGYLLWGFGGLIALALIVGAAFHLRRRYLPKKR
jgi:membrane protein DedA with SNARE-associated domain